MSSTTTTAIPSGATLATTIAYANSNIAAIVNTITGNLEGRGASVPNMASRTVDETTVAFNASVNTWTAEAGFNGFVVTGLAYSSASGFTATYTSGTAWVLQTSSDPDQLRRIVVSSNVTVLCTASSDNYIYLKTDGTLGAAVTTVGGVAPTLPADTLLLSVATTDGSTVSSTVDKRVTSGSATAKHYRSASFWPDVTSATNVRVGPGIVEIGGSTFETTTNNDLAVNVAGNYVSGSQTSNIWIYSVVADNSGSLKFGLTTSAPSATTIIGNATSGSAGRLQYRTIGGLPYRYLGAQRLVGGGTLIRGTRNHRAFFFASAQSLLSGGTSTSYTSVAGTSRIPSTSRLGILRIMVSGGNAGNSFVRENGTVGTGYKFDTSPDEPQYTIQQTTSTSQKVDYLANNTNAMDIDAMGYVEALD